MRRAGLAPAVVLGAGVNLIEVVRSLALAGIPVAVVAPAGDAATRSRHAESITAWNWPARCSVVEETTLVDALVAFAARQRRRPPLLFTSDEALLFCSQHRDPLMGAFELNLPPAELVETLVDKGRFAALAQTLQLPVPKTKVVAAGDPPPDVSDLRFPLVVKPHWRSVAWHRIIDAKACLAESDAALHSLWPRVASTGAPLVIQEHVPGPESRVESYHVYRDRTGTTLAEMTGRKIRTLPIVNGHTTSLVVTDHQDVLCCGRAVVECLDLRGVAKLDFKRTPDDRLVLLEVNARCSLWHHPAARAGVNFPAIVYADLIGTPPTPSRARSGLRWVHPLDAVAARRSGETLRAWMRWARSCDTWAFWSWDDPLPLLSTLLATVWARVRDVHVIEHGGRRYGEPGRRLPARAHPDGRSSATAPRSAQPLAPRSSAPSAPSRPGTVHPSP